MSTPTLKKKKQAHVLLIEDNFADAHLTLEVFKTCHMPIAMTWVKDGVDAIEHLKKVVPHGTWPLPNLILLDLILPRKSGLEVLQVVKNDEKLMEIPVLVLTSSTADLDKNRAYESKANFYITKPTKLDDFFGLMEYVEDIWLKCISPAIE